MLTASGGGGAVPLPAVATVKAVMAKPSMVHRKKSTSYGSLQQHGAVASVGCRAAVVRAS